jgi:multiple sugar transport system ATP-binding protein
MGVRPDALSIMLQKPQDEAMIGKVYVNELLGSDMIVDVDLGRERVRVKTSTEFAGKEGDICYITANRSKWHAFSKETGRAIF